MELSLCVVAYNEERYLPGLFRDILEQSYPHKKIEVLLVDSMSADGTRACMEQFMEQYRQEFLDVRILSNPGQILACGWNEALVEFSTEAIVRIDAHSHIPPEFVENNVRNLESGESVSGGIRPTVVEKDTIWGHTLLQAEESMFGSSISPFRRNGEHVYVKSLFHGMYRREVFETVGGYREDLFRTEDNEIHYRIRKHGFRLCMSPEIISYQYIRPTLRKMCRQKFANGYWIGLTAGVCPACLDIYYFVPGAFIAGIVLTSVLAAVGFPQLAILMWSLYGILAVGMAIAGVRKERKHLLQCCLPFLFLVIHVSYGLGTVVGLCKMPFWRRKHKYCESVERVKERLHHGKETT
jgi:glycosyltransferase involved in cell wall biosynthesis